MQINLCENEQLHWTQALIIPQRTSLRGLGSASCLCKIGFWKHEKFSEVNRTVHVFSWGLLYSILKVVAPSNSHWLIKKALKSTKTIVWTAFGHPGNIGYFFFDENVNAESYQEIISQQFHPEFCAFENSSENLYLCKMVRPQTGLKLSRTG